MCEKSRIRKQFQLKKPPYTPERVIAGSAQIMALLAPYLTNPSFQTIAAYMPHAHEIDIMPFLKRCLTQKKILYLPKYENKQYQLAPVTCLKTGLQEGKYGILEPISAISKPYPNPNLWLIPGLFFDKAGGRLGHGLGFYDHLLKGKTGLKMGLCYAWQRVDTLPQEPHDINMDRVIDI